MHDPMTVAFQIKYPWWNSRPWPKSARKMISRGWTRSEVWERMTDAEKKGCSPHWDEGYRDTFATIWHVDPERDGSDDSCGWCTPHLSDKQRDRLKSLSWIESRYPYFLRCNSKVWVGTRHEAECLYRGLVLAVAQAIGVGMAFDEAAKWAANAIHNSDSGDAANVFCFVRGYHSNLHKEDMAEEETAQHDREWRESVFLGIIQNLARWILKSRRPWYRHPKWHFWHWKIQVGPLGNFKRWAFSRCCKCGGRFKWGESPVSNSWHGTGPRWFRSEPDCYHSNCGSAPVLEKTSEPPTKP